MVIVPEGLVYAGQGSLFLRRDTGVVYQKQTGIHLNIGWQAVGSAAKYSTLIDIVSSTTETDVFFAAGYPIVASALGLSGVARATLDGDFLNNSGSTVSDVLKIYRVHGDLERHVQHGYGGDAAYLPAAVRGGQPRRCERAKPQRPIGDLGVGRSHCRPGFDSGWRRDRESGRRYDWEHVAVLELGNRGGHDAGADTPRDGDVELVVGQPRVACPALDGRVRLVR